MCEAWGISYSTYSSRLEAGRSQQEALTGAKQASHGKPCQDHEGNTFPSVSAMCRAWKISLSIFQGRIRRGLTLEEALTAPVKKNPPSHHWHLNL